MVDQNRNGLAKFSFFLGFISLFLMLGVFTAIPGVISGHMARSRAISYPHQYTGSRIAMMGLIMCYVSIALLILLVAIGNHLHASGDLIPFLDTIDSSGTLGSYLKMALEALRKIPFLSFFTQ